MPVRLVNRRQIMLAAGGAAAGSLFVRSPQRMAAAQSLDDRTLDVAVIGGGVSGAYAAWRLASGDAAQSARLKATGVVGVPRVALFEASDRIGGRLWSFVPPGMPHLRAELGGMRIPTYQTLVVELVKHLGIETIPFPMGDTHNLRYFRGRRYTVADLTNPAIVPYDLPPDLRGKAPNDILIGAIERYIPNAGQLTEAEWNSVRQSGAYDGVPLHELGFRALMQNVLPDEAFLFIRDDSGVEWFTLSGSAVDLMHEWAADFSLETSVVTPLLGMQEIPSTLARSAEQEGAIIARGHHLQRISRIHDAGADEPGLRLEFIGLDGAPQTWTARHVILAMPPRAISLLAADSLPLREPGFPALQDSLIPIQVGKGFLGYERPWWSELGLSSGRSKSDLPLRMTYYMGTEGDRPGANPNDTTSLLMPSYAEFGNLDFWMSFRRQSPDTPGGAPFQRPEIGLVPDELAMPERAVEEMQRQLQVLHGPEVQIGDPTMAVMSDWSRDPYGGGYHFWAVGKSPWDVIPVTREPVPGVNLSICGEAWSTRQGWSLGALMTAERLMQERFELTWPDWLPEGVDLGP